MLISKVKALLQCLSCFILLGVAAPAAAHTYFFGLTEISVNEHSKKLEIIHQFTAHDVENLIAEQQQINFSTESVNYETFIKNYFEQHFSLMRDDNQVKLNWLGLEVSLGKIFIYQESASQQFLSGLTIKNQLLIGIYDKQINTVNYRDPYTKGSLTFSRSKQFVLIPNIN